MLIESEIDKALNAYTNGYHSLWKQVQANPTEFPSGAITSGTIAEYYAKKYLEKKYDGYDVSFGSPNEKSWDIRVSRPHDQDIIRFQIKSISRHSKSRKLSPLVRGFDQLIVITLDYDFFPLQAFLFDDQSVLFGKDRITVLTVPSTDSKNQKGSKLFSRARNIHEEFFEHLANNL